MSSKSSLCEVLKNFFFLLVVVHHPRLPGIRVSCIKTALLINSSTQITEHKHTFVIDFFLIPQSHFSFKDSAGGALKIQNCH